MSIGNFFYKWLAASKHNTKTVTGDYTARVGAGSDSFNVDAVIDADDLAANSALTIPDGQAPFQMLLVTMSSNANSKTLTITCSTGTDYTIATAGYQVLLMWDGSAWFKVAGTTTT